MDYRLIPRSHHEYKGSREQANVLISGLMDRGYWIEATYSCELWTVTCGLAPEELPPAVRNLINPTS